MTPTQNSTGSRWSNPTNSASNIVPATKTTLAACPSANGITYTSTRPLPTLLGTMIYTSLEFLIECNTNWLESDGVTDLQGIANVTSMQDCIDACATYAWQTKIEHYPAHGCSGVVWTSGVPGDVNAPADSCWLKANVSQYTHNSSSLHPGFDGAILLYYDQ